MGKISEKFKDYNFLFDSHAHLSTGTEYDIDSVLENSEQNDVKAIFDMGVDINSSKIAVEKAKKYSQIKAFVGIDPEAFEPGSTIFARFEVDDAWFEKVYSDLKQLISDNKEYIAGVGETGMDFYHIKDLNDEDKIKSTLNQERLFRTHLEIATQTNLPLSIHSRGAEAYCLDVVKGFTEVTGIFHSYTGDYETAKQILDSGWGIGVNGIITFKNAEPLRDVFRKLIGKIPDDIDFKDLTVGPKYFYEKGIFFETDAPYLSPEGKRGEQNEPANVRMVYDHFVKMLQS